MDNKRKPYATLTIRKPRMSQVAATTIMILLAALAVSWHLSETSRLKQQALDASARLQERSDALRQARVGLHEAEAQLADAEARLNASLASWRLQEPVGFYIDPEDYLSGRRMLKAVACIGAADGFEPYIAYGTADPDVIAEFVGRDDYVLAGQAKASADWSFTDEISEDFYTRADVMEKFPYRWSDLRAWLSNESNWYDRLYTFCEEAARQQRAE